MTRARSRILTRSERKPAISLWKSARSESPCQACQMRDMFSVFRLQEAEIIAQKLNSNYGAFSELCPPLTLARASSCWFNYSKTQICQADNNMGKYLAFLYWERSPLLTLLEQLCVPVVWGVRWCYQLSFRGDSLGEESLFTSLTSSLGRACFPPAQSTTEISHLML